MPTDELENYYEVLQASPDASMQTLESLFVKLTKLYHPEISDSGNQDKFNQISKAFETLRDPESRRAYDAQFVAPANPVVAPISESASIAGDVCERSELLKLYYTRRRDDMKNPGLGSGGVEGKTMVTAKVLEFHLWYLVEKGWLKRQEGGRLAITAEGVDKLEFDSRELKAA